MPKNSEYTQEYFEIMDELHGDIQGRRDTQTYMKQSTAIVHHEVVASTFVPRLYNKETLDTFTAIAETTHDILCKVINHYIEYPDYRSIFSYDKRLEELILLPRYYDAILPFARVDVFYDEDHGCAPFCEFNADGSSGMNEDREVVASISSSATFKRFSERHSVKSSNLFEPWVSEFLHIYASYTHAVENPHIAICDFLDHAVIDEFKIFASLFEKQGVACSIYDVRDLVFDGVELKGSDGKLINAIWRRSVTNDILDHWSESQALIEAVRNEKVALIGSFAGHIVHDKQIFRALFDPRTKAFLTNDEITFIEEHVPYTTFLDDAHANIDKIIADKDKWIIKPTDHYGADHVFAGSYWSQQEWAELVKRYTNNAQGSPFIAQHYITPFKTMTLPPDSGIENLKDEEIPRKGVPYNNLQGLYIYNGKFRGVFSRLGPKPTISKDMQGITAATIWVDCEGTSA